MANSFDQGDGRQTTRSLPIRGSVDRIMELWDSRREELLDGIPAASCSLRSGIDQGRWGTTFRLTLGFDAPPPCEEPGPMASRALRRLKSLAEAGVPPRGERSGGGGGDRMGLPDRRRPVEPHLSPR